MTSSVAHANHANLAYLWVLSNYIFQFSWGDLKHHNHLVGAGLFSIIVVIVTRNFAACKDISRDHCNI